MSSTARVLADRRELEMQLVEAAQDEGRRVAEPPCARGAVLRLRYPDVAHAIEDPLEGDPPFGAGQWSAGAGVDASPEREVLPGVAPVQPELVGVLELSGIAVGCAVQHHDRRPGRDLDVPDG